MKIMLTKALFIFSACLPSSANANIDLKKYFSSISILKDVIQKSESKHHYDWRSKSLELELNYGYIDEKNNFENNVIGFNTTFMSPTGFSYRIGLKRIDYWPTKSSNLVGRTPFKQEAGANRYQISLSGLYSIMEGRAITRISPSISDVEFALFTFIGGSYNHHTATLTPAIKESSFHFPGQDPITPRFSLDLGLKWNLYLPNSYGIALEYAWGVPVENVEGLNYWAQFLIGSFVSF